MRKNLLQKSLKSISSLFKKEDPSILALKTFLGTKEMKLRKPDADISFAEFATYLEKENPTLWETTLSKQDPKSEEKSIIFFREWIALDKKAKVEKLPSSSPLETTPQDITTEMARSLSAKDLVNVSLASKTTHRMFEKPRKAAKLLHLVREADYEAAEAMVKEEPSLMFQYVSYQNADGIYETISPVQLAVKQLDTYMWKMFEEQAKNSHVYERFLKQAHAQKEHVNLEPLFDAYKTYNEKYSLWTQNQLSEGELDKAWLNVGMAQRDILPRWMLKTFLSSTSWGTEVKFDVDVETRPGIAEVWNHDTQCSESVLPLHRDSGLGFDFTLIRARSGVISGGRGRNGWGTSADTATFRHLCEVRTNDLSRLPSVTAVQPSTHAVKK